MAQFEKSLVAGIFPAQANSSELQTQPSECSGTNTFPKRNNAENLLCKRDAAPLRFNYADGTFELRPTGVFFIRSSIYGGAPQKLWLCSPLTVAAKTRSIDGSAWGRLLTWQDDDGHSHRWAMPLELLQGDGAEMRRELARQGGGISTERRAREALSTYIQICPVTTRVRCVGRLGWCGAGFVLPSETIGKAGEAVVFQNALGLTPTLSSAGAPGDWRSSVAAQAQGNTRLVFAISTAFAGALLEPAGEESGGFHLRGAASSGKTTALRAAASVWGNPSAYVRLRRATTNGLEGLAALHNDGLLILDEIQVDPKQAGEVAYMLANGQGKARASRSGAAQPSARWRLLFLSSGEVPLATMMQLAGRSPNAGQEVRLADIEADAGAGLGAFEYLHGMPDGSAFAEAIGNAASRSYGTAGPAWLHSLVADRSGLKARIVASVGRFVAASVPSGDPDRCGAYSTGRAFTG